MMKLAGSMRPKHDRWPGAWQGKKASLPAPLSGMNVVGAIALARELGKKHTVVTVAVDSGMKYLAGDLYGQESP